MNEASISAQVIALLKKREGEILRYSQIRDTIGCSPGALSASLNYNLGSEVGDWAHVERTARGRYVYRSPAGDSLRPVTKLESGHLLMQDDQGAYWVARPLAEALS